MDSLFLGDFWFDFVCRSQWITRQINANEKWSAQKLNKNVFKKQNNASYSSLWNLLFILFFYSILFFLFDYFIGRKQLFYPKYKDLNLIFWDYFATSPCIWIRFIDKHRKKRKKNVKKFDWSKRHRRTQITKWEHRNQIFIYLFFSLSSFTVWTFHDDCVFYRWNVLHWDRFENEKKCSKIFFNKKKTRRSEQFTYSNI